MAASQALLVCAQDSCPSVLQKDCIRWLDEVREAMPTIVVGVRDPSGNDLEDASVSVNDRIIQSVLEGTAVEVDPGRITIRIQARGWAPVEKVVLVRQGEKNRLLTFQVTKRVEPSSSGSASSQEPDVETAKAVTFKADGSSKTWAYVGGGLGIVGLGLGGYFAYSASQNWKTRNEHCQNSICDDEAVSASNDAHTNALVADISLAVGVVGLGVGTYLWLSDTGNETTANSDRTPSVRATVGTDGAGPNLVILGSW